MKANDKWRWVGCSVPKSTHTHTHTHAGATPESIADTTKQTKMRSKRPREIGRSGVWGLAGVRPVKPKVKVSVNEGV